MIKNIQRLTQSFSHLRFSFARAVKKVNEKKPVEVEESEEFDQQQNKEASKPAQHENFLARKIIDKIDGMSLANELGNAIERRLKAGISFEQIINEGFADISTEKKLDSDDKTRKKPLDKDAEDIIKLKKIIDGRLDETIKENPNYLEEIEKMFKNLEFVPKETIEYLEKNRDAVENSVEKKFVEKEEIKLRKKK